MQTFHNGIDGYGIRGAGVDQGPEGALVDVPDCPRKYIQGLPGRHPQTAPLIQD